MAMLARADVDLYYECVGDGPPLLLIAGLASDSLSWQPIVADLAAHYRVITVDNRGAGRTTPQTAPTTIRAMADDCVALIEHLGLASAHVLGHSMGGFVAQDCAIRYPDKVDALVLAATSSVNSRRNNDIFSDWAAALANGADTKAWLRNLFYWLFSTRFFSNDAVVDAAIQYALTYPYPQSPAAFQNQVDAIAAFDSTDDLSRIRANTLVVAGTDDLLFPLSVCKGFANVIPNCAFVEHVIDFLPQR